MAWILSTAVRERVRSLNKQKISARTLDRWVERGLLPPPTYFGNRRHWPSEQLDAHDVARLAAAVCGVAPNLNCVPDERKNRRMIWPTYGTAAGAYIALANCSAKPLLSLVPVRRI